MRKKKKKEQKNSKKESVQHKESIIIQQHQHHPNDLEVDLDAEIRSKRLSSIEEIKECAVDLSNLTMQTWEFGTIMALCRSTEGTMMWGTQRRRVHVDSLSSCTRREALYCSQLKTVTWDTVNMRRWKRSKPTHTLSESCANFPETASILRRSHSGNEIREFLEKHKLCANRNTVHRLKKKEWMR